jgi:hypothetical protein
MLAARMTRTHHRARLPRVLATGILLLCAGLISNIAVAWFLALAIDVTTGQEQVGIEHTNQKTWQVSSWSRAGARRYRSQRIIGLGGDPAAFEAEPGELAPRWSGLHAAGIAFETGRAWREVRSIDARGWPMISHWCECDTEIRYRDGRTATRALRGAFGLPLAAVGTVGCDRALPLRPIATGAVVNTLAFASMWWLAITVPRVFRRRLRRITQRCLECGYPAMSDGTHCSECGGKLPNSYRAVQKPCHRISHVNDRGCE